MQVLAKINPDRSFDFSDLDRAILQSREQINKNASRTQMYNYEQAGLLTRIGTGQFKMTESLLASIQIVPPATSAEMKPERRKLPRRSVESDEQTEAASTGEVSAAS
jgi:hypothetical protein